MRPALRLKGTSSGMCVSNCVESTSGSCSWARFLRTHGRPAPEGDVASLDGVALGAQVDEGDFVCLVAAAADGAGLTLVPSVQKVELSYERMNDLLRAAVDGEPDAEAGMREVDGYADVDALLPLELMIRCRRK